MSPAETTEASPPGAKQLREHLKQTMYDGRFGAVLLFDIDGLRELNAEHGHEQGDCVIQLIGEYVSQRGWTCYRVGGDEFGLVIEDSADGLDEEEFRVGVSLFVREHSGSQVTISGGGVRHPGSEFAIDPRMDDILFSTAHQLLVRAKQRGRNQILWLPRGPVESADLMRILVRFYEELARISASLVRELEIESRIDYLTGLANRRGFEDAFHRMIESAQRSDNPLGLIYLDSDSLKRINDTQGHEAGDRFIVDIARVLNHVVRGSDFISRWGADEFAVLMDNASDQNAAALARRIHEVIAARTDGTVSVGVYCGVPTTAEEAVKAADLALYRAKQNGKNRVELAH